MSFMDKFFNPKSIAVIGVSSNPQKVGRVIFDNLLNAGKNVYPVNPGLGLVSGVRCYNSLTELVKEKGKIDLIIVCVPVLPTLLIMNEAGHFIELQGTAEEKHFNRDELNNMLALAEIGIPQLIELQKSA